MYVLFTPPFDTQRCSLCSSFPLTPTPNSYLAGAGLGTAGSVDAAAAAADTALAEVQQQLQALYVQRRLQALHPRVDSYLTTLALTTPAPAAATKLSPLKTASTSTAVMPIPSGGGAATCVSDELLHVVHGLLAVQVRVVLLWKTRRMVSAKTVMCPQRG